MTRVSRYTLKPIDPEWHNEWLAYKQQVSAFWVPEEVSLTRDVEQWARLHPDERAFIKVVLAFFAASDGIVGENLVENFMLAFEAPEVRCFYTFQAAMENIHAEMYANLIEALIADSQEQRALLSSVSQYACVNAKAAWALRWLNNPDVSLGERLVAFAAVEGIFFSCSFCAIFWLKKRNLMPGLCMSNEFISRDEGMHTRFACMLVNRLPDKPGSAAILAIIRDAVDTERQYVREALCCDLIGINASLMEQYLECVADVLLRALGCAPAYGSSNPFEWMTLMTLDGKSNMFERPITEYRIAMNARDFQVTSDF